MKIRAVEAGSAWLLAVMVAMFAAVISFSTPAEAQPRSNIAPCERVLFAAFYAASVEGVSQSRLTACLAGAIQPTNRVFRSWSEAPALLSHLKHVDPRLLHGVTRESLPSPGQVALANYGALIARCELVEETSDGGVVEADANVADTAPNRHRSRVRLSKRAMRNHAWDPFAWFPSRCARRLSIEIRPAEAVMVSHVVRNDAFVADATRRLADPARDLAQIPTLVTGLQSRLADTGSDPIPASLFSPLAAACLATIAALPPTCFAASSAGSSGALEPEERAELIRLRDQNRRLRGTNSALRGELRDTRSSMETLKSLPFWLAVTLVVMLVLFALIMSWAFSSNERLGRLVRKQKAALANAEEAGAYEKGRSEGRKEVFLHASRIGWVDLPDSGLPTLLSPAAVKEEVDAFRQYYDKEVVHPLYAEWRALNGLVGDLSRAVFNLYPEGDARRNHASPSAEVVGQAALHALAAHGEAYRVLIESLRALGRFVAPRLSEGDERHSTLSDDESEPTMLTMALAGAYESLCRTLEGARQEVEVKEVNHLEELTELVAALADISVSLDRAIAERSPLMAEVAFNDETAITETPQLTDHGPMEMVRRVKSRLEIALQLHKPPTPAPADGIEQ